MMLCYSLLCACCLWLPLLTDNVTDRISYATPTPTLPAGLATRTDDPVSDDATTPNQIVVSETHTDDPISNGASPSQDPTAHVPTYVSSSILNVTAYVSSSILNVTATPYRPTALETHTARQVPDGITSPQVITTLGDLNNLKVTLNEGDDFYMKCTYHNDDDHHVLEWYRINGNRTMRVSEVHPYQQKDWRLQYHEPNRTQMCYGRHGGRGEYTLSLKNVGIYNSGVYTCIPSMYQPFVYPCCHERNAVYLTLDVVPTPNVWIHLGKVFVVTTKTNSSAAPLVHLATCVTIQPKGVPVLMRWSFHYFAAVTNVTSVDNANGTVTWIAQLWALLTINRAMSVGVCNVSVNGSHAYKLARLTNVENNPFRIISLHERIGDNLHMFGSVDSNPPANLRWVMLPGSSQVPAVCLDELCVKFTCLSYNSSLVVNFDAIVNDTDFIFYAFNKHGMAYSGVYIRKSKSSVQLPVLVEYLPKPKKPPPLFLTVIPKSRTGNIECDTWLVIASVISVFIGYFIII